MNRQECHRIQLHRPLTAQRLSSRPSRIQFASNCLSPLHQKKKISSSERVPLKPIRKILIIIIIINILKQMEVWGYSQVAWRGTPMLGLGPPNLRFRALGPRLVKCASVECSFCSLAEGRLGDSKCLLFEVPPGVSGMNKRNCRIFRARQAICMSRTEICILGE